jgi:hypothetical protein
LARERQSPHPPETIAGTLAYMAPEQTGRMNRSIDSRIEHAGAERGLLITPRSERLHIDAEATTRGEDVIVQLREGAHTAGVLPEVLVRYAMRTRETVMLDDASSQNRFTADPYIIRAPVPFSVCH